MREIIETDGADYEISTSYDNKNHRIKINLKINARDWKKPSDFEVMLTEDNYPFKLDGVVILGEEERWPGENGTEIDYKTVLFSLIATSLSGNRLYKQTINTSAKFFHDIDFYIRPLQE